MTARRIERINSLLREVISEVIQRDVKNPHVKTILTITGVETTKDLHHAKVFVSVIGTPEQKKETINALQSASGFIAVNASKKIVLRYFPELHFKLDEGAEHHQRIEELLSKIKEDEKKNPTPYLLDDEEADDSDEDSEEDASDIEDEEDSDGRDSTH